MTEIVTPAYQGPERRKKIIFEECGCHLKHDLALRTHRQAIKTLENDMKTKVNWKLFALAILIIIGSSGFLYREINATDDSINAVDKRLEGVSVRQEVFEQNAAQSLGDIKDQLYMLNRNLNNHMRDWKESNGMKKEEK